jgi:hypothetical protein
LYLPFLLPYMSIFHFHIFSLHISFFMFPVSSLFLISPSSLYSFPYFALSSLLLFLYFHKNFLSHFLYLPLNSVLPIHPLSQSDTHAELTREFCLQGSNRRHKR